MLRKLAFLATAALVACCALVACFANLTVQVEYPSYEGDAGDAALDGAPVQHKFGSTVVPVATTFSYAAGDGGTTLIVPALTYLAGLTICAGSTNGYVTIGVAGPLADGAIVDGSIPGQTITIVANQCWSLPAPIPGGLFDLGPGTQVVFSGGIMNYYGTYNTYGSF